MTALMERQLVESLNMVERAIKRWREGKGGVFEAHSELLKHAAKAERQAERMARIGLDNAGSLLRDAFDIGIIDREDFLSFVGREPEDVTPSPPLSEPAIGPGLPDKRELIEELLADGPILIHIDARNALAQVPVQFRKDPKLVLRFGYGLTPSIIDLSIDSDAICGTLTFGGVPFRCVLPWASVYSVVSEADQKGMVWPADVPSCVVDAISGATRADTDSEPPEEEEEDLPTFPPSPNEAAGAGKPALGTVESGDDGGDPLPPPPRGGGGHLKLVK